MTTPLRVAWAIARCVIVGLTGRVLAVYWTAGRIDTVPALVAFGFWLFAAAQVVRLAVLDVTATTEHRKP